LPAARSWGRLAQGPSRPEGTTHGVHGDNRGRHTTWGRTRDSTGCWTT
jgi:hypothetical protein